MSYPIVRLYKTAKQAMDAVEALKSIHIGADLIHVVKPPEGASSVDAVAASIAQGWVAADRARALAKEVVNGNFLVSCRAPFGFGVGAGMAMDEFDPIATPPEEFTTPVRKGWGPTWSSAGWSVLIDPLIGDTSFGFPVLARWKSSTILMNPILGKTSFGLPLLWE